MFLTHQYTLAYPNEEELEAFESQKASIVNSSPMQQYLTEKMMIYIALKIQKSILLEYSKNQTSSSLGGYPATKFDIVKPSTSLKSEKVNEYCTD